LSDSSLAHSTMGPIPKRSVRTAGAINSAFSVFSSATNVVLVPFLLGIYGLKVYGALSLLTSLAQYFNVLDLGLSSALVRHWVRVRTQADFRYFRYRRLTATLVTTIGLTVVVSGAATAGHWRAALQLGHIDHLGLAVLGAGSLTVITLVGNCYNSALIADLSFLHLNIYNYTRNIGPQLVAALVYLLAADLATALLGGALFALLLLLTQITLLRRREPRRGEGRDLSLDAPFALFLRESIGFSAQSVLTALYLPLIQISVGAKFGSEANGLVDVARRLLFAFRRAIEAAFVPLFARASQLIERGHLRQVQAIAFRGTLLSVSIASVYFVGLRVSLRWILRIWIPDSAAAVQPVASTFLYGVALTIPSLAIFQILSTSQRGRMVNSLAAALSAAVLLLALTPLANTVTDVLALYAAGVFLAAVLTLGYGVRYVACLPAQGTTSTASDDASHAANSPSEKHY
jgi:O-antigen/teichoic acid export membrane protein